MIDNIDQARLLDQYDRDVHFEKMLLPKLARAAAKELKDALQYPSQYETIDCFMDHGEHFTVYFLRIYAHICGITDRPADVIKAKWSSLCYDIFSGHELTPNELINSTKLASTLAKAKLAPFRSKNHTTWALAFGMVYFFSFLAELFWLFSGVDEPGLTHNPTLFDVFKLELQCGTLVSHLRTAKFHYTFPLLALIYIPIDFWTGYFFQHYWFVQYAFFSIIYFVAVVLLIAEHARLGFYAFVAQMDYDVIDKMRRRHNPHQFPAVALAYWTQDCEILPDYRSVFRSHSYPSSRPKQNHPHPYSAAARGEADAFINSVIGAMGKTPFSLSTSKNDDFTGIEGDRLYYWAQDLQQNSRAAAIKPHHAVKMVDVDYYVDVPNLILRGQPLLLYTINPLKPAGTAGEASYTFADDGKFLMRLPDVTHTHDLWDYDTDVIVTKMEYRTVVSLVATRRIDDLRVVVLINPIRVIDGPLSEYVLGPELKRHRANRALNTLMTRYQIVNDGNSEPMVCLACVGGFVNVEITEAAYLGVLAKYESGELQSNKPVSADAERVLQSIMPGRRFDASFAASLLHTQYVHTRGTLAFETLIIKGSASPRQYQTLMPLIHEKGIPSVLDHDTEIGSSGRAPMQSLNNDTSFVKERIHRPKNLKKRFPKFFYRNKAEFINFIVGDHRHTLCPVSQTTVEEKQNRPSQRSNRLRAMGFLYNAMIKVRSFMKREVYGKVGAPRAITTVDPDHQLRLSQFTLASAEVIKTQPWYAFALTPVRLAARVHEVVVGSTQVKPTDYCRLDGSLSTFHEELELDYMLSLFQPRYHPELRELLTREHRVNASTTHGVRYDTESTRLSGSPITSQGNTLINAFENYSAFRETKSPEEARKALGIYGGDDGIVADSPDGALEKQAAFSGLKLKTETLLPGSPVPFLGRIYLDPWTSDESVIDVKRQLTKLTMSSDRQCPLNSLLIRKAESWLVTDTHTPVISHIAQAITRLLPLETLTKTERKFVKRSLQMFKNDIGYWGVMGMPFPPLKRTELAWSVVAENLGVSVQDIMRFTEDVAKCQTIDALLQMRIPGAVEPKVELDVEMNGQIYYADQADVPPPQPRSTLFTYGPAGDITLQGAWITAPEDDEQYQVVRIFVKGIEVSLKELEATGNVAAIDALIDLEGALNNLPGSYKPVIQSVTSLIAAINLKRTKRPSNAHSSKKIKKSPPVKISKVPLPKRTLPERCSGWSALLARISAVSTGRSELKINVSPRRLNPDGTCHRSVYVLNNGEIVDRSHLPAEIREILSKMDSELNPSAIPVEPPAREPYRGPGVGPLD